MPAVTTTEQLLGIVQKSELATREQLDAFVEKLRQDGPLPRNPRDLATAMVRGGLITQFQAKQLLQGKWRGFFILGKYKLLRLLGAGGTARVYLCQHLGLDRLVALKFLPLQPDSDGQAIKRFFREARAVASLNHPNIVRVFDIDRADKLHFMVLEYVDGPNLHELVQRQGVLDIIQAANFIRQAAEGLKHAHEHGWIHRDVKPGNLLVDRSGVVKLLDLGLARVFSHEAGDVTMHEVRGVGLLGTVDYISPEQAVRSNECDIRADIYSLGATFRYLLTGRPPFDSDAPVTNRLLWLQLREPPPVRQLRPEIPAEMEFVINRMMAKDPEARFQTPAEVVEVLNYWNPAKAPQTAMAAHARGGQPGSSYPGSGDGYQPPSWNEMGRAAAATNYPEESSTLAPSEPTFPTFAPNPTSSNGVSSAQLSWAELTRPYTGEGHASAYPAMPAADGGTASQMPTGAEIDDEDVLASETAVLQWRGASLNSQAHRTSWDGWARLREGDWSGLRASLGHMPTWLMVSIFVGGWVLAASALVAVPLMMSTTRGGDQAQPPPAAGVVSQDATE